MADYSKRKLKFYSSSRRKHSLQQRGPRILRKKICCTAYSRTISRAEYSQGVLGLGDWPRVSKNLSSVPSPGVSSFLPRSRMTVWLPCQRNTDGKTSYER